MVTHPANMVMTMIPRAVASIPNFERIQNFLLSSSRHDHRLDVKLAREQSARVPRIDDRKGAAVVIENLTVHPSSAARPILEDINLKIDAGSIVVCCGRVGTGKTTLARCILVEITPSSGSISVITKRIGFCAQVPWLPSGSIRNAIRGSLGKLDNDIQWYESVIDACSLRADLENFPEGDLTQIGSRGLNISGGQRQRLVSLAVC